MSKIYRVRVHVAPEVRDETRESPLRFRASDGTYYLGQDDLRLARTRGWVLEPHQELDERALPVRFLLPGGVNDPPPQSARLAVLARLLAEGRAGGDVHIRFLGRNRSVPPDGFVLDRAEGARCYVWQVVPSESLEGGQKLAERFRALRSRLADPERRVVLSLGSGGLKLFSHATVLRLLEGIGSMGDVDEIWGSSAGALVALLYCYGLSPHAIEQTGYDLYGGRYALELRPTKLGVLRSLLRDAILPATGTASAGFVDCTQGLQRMLAHYCDEIDEVRPFYCPAFNLARGETEVLTPAPVPPHLVGFMHRTDARDAALASAAVPLLFVPRDVRVGSEVMPYIDGSTTEGVPIFSPVRKWDLDREAAVESRSKLTIVYVKLSGAVRVARTGRVSKLRLLQTIASAGVETMHHRDLALVRGRPDIELVPLELLDAGTDFFETRRIPEFIRLAKETFPEQLARIEDRLREGEESSRLTA